MKRLFITILIIVPVLFSSCSDFLERGPVDALSPSTFWHTENDAYLALVGCYHEIEEIYGGYNLMYWDVTSDNLFNSFSWEGYKPYVSGMATPTNIGRDFFTFLDIRACNEYLENEGSVEWSTAGLQEQYKAEARTLRAMLYFWKTEMYGDFPLITETIDDPMDALLPRTDVAEVRKFIVEELEAAIPGLPDKSGTIQSRVNKQTAQATLMRYYLYQSDYANALKYAEDIRSGGQVSLPTNLTYDEAFLVANQYNSETIFSHTYLEGTSNKLYLPPFMPNAIGGWSSVVPNKQLVEAYEMKDGRTIEEAAATGDYDESNPFVNRDPRLRATVLYPGQKYSNYDGMPDGCYNSMPQYFKDGTTANADYWSNADNASKTGLQFKKFLQNLEQFSSTESATTTVPIYRYAEVLLTIAECNVELGQNMSDVYTCLNEVRNRAGMPDVDQSKYNTWDSLRELVRRERRVELAGEGLRRADLKRWGLLYSTMSGFEIYHYGGDVLTTVNAEGDYNVRVITAANAVTEEEKNEIKPIAGQTYTFQKHQELLPIDQKHIDSNPNIKQNPDY